MTYQSRCTRHAFTDGECAFSGCRDCPGRAEIAIAAPTRRLSPAHLVAAFLAPGLILWALIGIGALVDQGKANIRAAIVASQGQ